MAGERIADMFDWVLGGALLEYDSDANVAQARCVLWDSFHCAVLGHRLSQIGMSYFTAGLGDVLRLS